MCILFGTLADDTGKIVIILNSKNEISGEEEYNEQLLNITQGNDGISSTHLIIFWCC